VTLVIFIGVISLVMIGIKIHYFSLQFQIHSLVRMLLIHVVVHGMELIFIVLMIPINYTNIADLVGQYRIVLIHQMQTLEG